jgi:low affinity Fe/Cu permease
MTFRHPVERTGARRGRFERLAGAASHVTASPVFYFCCLLLIAAFIAVHLAGVPVEWMLFTGDWLAAVNLLLLALLKNSELRAEHAIQRKLDAIAAALLEQREGRAHTAHDALERAIRMEEEL